MKELKMKLEPSWKKHRIYHDDLKNPSLGEDFALVEVRKEL